MQTKVFEIRDEGTCIAALAIKMVAANPIELVFLLRQGYPTDGHGVVLMHLGNQRASSDPYGHGNSRTMGLAHLHIIDHWDSLKDGDVIDVRVTHGGATVPAAPEIWLRASP